MISIVDYGMGNLGSLANMLRYLKIGSRIITDPENVLSSEKLILPGVGAFGSAMKRIREAGLFDALDTAVRVKGAPLLGVCLGMQLLTNWSEEGEVPGFGWIPGKTVKLKVADAGLKVPHMGWNFVAHKTSSALTETLSEQARFYFVHSYHVLPEDDKNVLLETQYGGSIVAGVGKDNVFGVQFHPEKSHRHGMEILKGFARL